MASMNYDGLKQLYASHVVEVKVIRRNTKPGFGPRRKFICTNSPLLLNSIAGKTAFHFTAPSQRPPFNAEAYNLITVYDLLIQAYRNVNLDTDVILAAMPIRNEAELTQFWEYFTQVMSKWSSSNKQMIMNM